MLANAFTGRPVDIGLDLMGARIPSVSGAFNRRLQ